MTELCKVIIGDIHGEADKLRDLLALIREKEGDNLELYNLGDLIDRGPKSKEVIQICIEENIQGILGNHELWFKQVCSVGELDDYCYSNIMGGVYTVQSYGAERGIDGNEFRWKIPRAHQEYILSLPKFRTIECAGINYILVHTGVSLNNYEAVLEETKLKTIGDIEFVRYYSNRREDSFFWTGTISSMPERVAKFKNHIQVYGHTPIKIPKLGGHYIALDTGCGTCAPYLLSALVLKQDGTQNIISV